MGGNVPLGYRVEARKLVVVETEAELVRRIFTRFAALGSALKVARELNAAGEVTKRWKANGAARRPRLDQGRHLQDPRQPGVSRPGGAQGRGLPRRARRDRRPGALGPRAWGHGRADPPARRHQPGAGADAAQGPDLRPERPRDVALAHQTPRPGAPLLRDPRGDRRGLRQLHGQERAGGGCRGGGAGAGAAAADHARDDRADLDAP